MRLVEIFQTKTALSSAGGDNFIDRLVRKRLIEMKPGLDISELEGLRVFAAWAILEYGDHYGFILQHIEEYLEEARKEDPRARALRVLSEMKSLSEKPAGVITFAGRKTSSQRR